MLNSRGARLEGDKLILDGVQPTATLFTSRPVRTVGHMATPDMVEIWRTGSFAKDPPNATASVFSKDGSSVADIVVVLKSPKLEGEKLTFDVHLLEGSLGKADGPASVFIDTIWFGVGSNGFPTIFAVTTIASDVFHGVRLADVHEGPLHAWMLGSGLTMDEIAMVQGAMNVDFGWMQREEHAAQTLAARAEVRGKLEASEIALRDNTSAALAAAAKRLPAQQRPAQLAIAPIRGAVIPKAAIPKPPAPVVAAPAP